MLTFDLPDDPLLTAFGKVSVRHGHLDYILKMTIKSIASLTIKQALDATDKQGSRELRERVRKLAKQRFGEGATLLLLDGFLNRSRQAVQKRNELLHGLYVYDADSNPVRRQDDHSFGPLPSVAEIDEIARELEAITYELNDARLNGFLKTDLDRTA